MINLIELQIVSKTKKIPRDKQLKSWVNSTLKTMRCKNKKILIRIVNKTESQHLNKTYRKKNKPTNVLSFPFENITNETTNFLGDIVICAPLLAAEASAQEKPWRAHWAHIVIHGVLHLLGYDHIKKTEARRMEALEIRILADLGYNDPYQES